MEPTFTEWQRQPRPLLYRSHYRWYAVVMAVAWGACLIAMMALSLVDYKEYFDEVAFFASFSIMLPALYLVWLHPKLTRTMQVFTDGIKITSAKEVFDIKFDNLESISCPFGSVVKFKMKDGLKWSFDSSLERLDYLWEAVWRSRPELVGNSSIYEEFRLKIVQYDHHEKRKEWFFRHRLIDILNWVVLPAVILGVGYKVQSADIVLHSTGLYFFRLGMFVLLATIISAFFFSVIFKKFVFDKKLEENIGTDRSKRRDIGHENIIIQRAKSLQLITCSVIMFGVLHAELNLYSVTRLREGAQAFNLKPGKTLVVDNRFNCLDCKHSLKEGDLIVFGKGSVGKILAVAGDVIAKTTDSKAGRTIASETVISVPENHLALQIGPEGREIVFVKIDDLVGKLKIQ